MKDQEVSNGQPSECLVCFISSLQILIIVFYGMEK